MKVKQTNNYRLFKEVDGNRDADPRKDLEQSLRKYGWIYPIICVLKDNLLRIIDGQHRFKTAVSMNLPIHYIEFKDMTREEEIHLIALVNNTSKPWTPMDYVKAWAQLDKIPYIEVLTLAKLHKFTVTTIMAICTVDWNDSRKKMRNGALELDAKLKGQTVLNYVSQLKQVTPFTNRMLEGFNKFYMSQDSFDLQEFKNNLANNLDLLTDVTERHVFADIFNRIYNS